MPLTVDRRSTVKIDSIYIASHINMDWDKVSVVNIILVWSIVEPQQVALGYMLAVAG